MRDRDQKTKALRYVAAKRWFPQLEVDVRPVQNLGKRIALVTDLDVLAYIPDDFRGFRSIIFDCKTKAKESAVNRSLWLRGILDRMQAEVGVCILQKNMIESDHKIMATELNIILLSEDEFDIYARSTTENYDSIVSHVSNIDSWERFFSVKTKYPNLGPAIDFSRSYYWMIKAASDRCRRALTMLREIRTELDPVKNEHVGVACDLAALFAHSLAILCSYLFKAYLHPKRQQDLDEAVKLLLYGGRESYEHRNRLFKMLNKQKNPDAYDGDLGLSLPEWPRLIKLIRQLLDAPTDISYSPLILRELSFSYINDSSDLMFARSLCQECPQGGRFSVLIIGYLFRAAKLPDEFRSLAENALLSLLNQK